MTVDDLIGKKIQGYEILDRIGQGGMATVYRALQTSMNRTVAVKVLPKHLMRDDTYLMRFQREADIISKLEHRNIIPVYDYGNDDGLSYLVMRYMPAGSLDDKIRLGALTPSEMLNIMQQIAPALDYAHARGVLHRDLKPSNILLDDDGGAYLTDFGIARIFDGDAKEDTITTQGIVGTPSYMSPEQAQGHTLDGRSDIYSLGISLFEMATGRRPFENETPYSIAVMQVTAQPPNPRNINPEIPLALEEVILKAIKKKPKNRFQTAVELVQALDVALQNPHARLNMPDYVMDSSLDVTQPSGILSEADFTVPHPVSMPTPTPQPKPLSYPSRPRTTPTPHSRPMRRKKPFNTPFWTSIIIGGLIGCALLTLMVTVLGMMANDFLRRDRAQSSTISTPIPSLDPTLEIARATMVGNAALLGLDSGTPVFANATPIPTRVITTTVLPPTAFQPVALPTDFDPELSELIYFSDSLGNLFDLFLVNLRTGEQSRLTQNEGHNTYPALSPDGRRIAFQTNRDGVWEIFIMDIASGEAVQLISSPHNQSMPSWSPDGGHIVFGIDNRDDGTLDLVRVKSDGSGEIEMIYSDGLRNSHPRYSPDGRYLVFANGSATNFSDWQIKVFDFSDGSVRQVSEIDSEYNTHPMFAPDGAILYVAGGTDGQRVIMRATGQDFNQRRRLYVSDGLVWGMHYTPDGKFIAFHEDHMGSAELMLMRVDGTDVMHLDGLKGVYPVWIP